MVFATHVHDRLRKRPPCSLPALINLPVTSTPSPGQDTLEPSPDSAAPFSLESLQGSQLTEYRAYLYQNPALASHLYLWKTPDAKIRAISSNHQLPSLLFCIRVPRESPEELINQPISHAPWISLVNCLIRHFSAEHQSSRTLPNSLSTQTMKVFHCIGVTDNKKHL